MDWRMMFQKYRDLVGGYEGVDYIRESDWSKEEYEAIEKLDEETYNAPS